MARVIKADTGCWEWDGTHNRGGYAQFWNEGRLQPAHCWAYEHWVGPIPAGLMLDHFHCDNRGCVNPLHVRPVTARENILRGRGITAANLSATHCPAGHPYSGDNLIIGRAGERRCKICRRATNLRSYHRRHSHR